MKRLVSLALCLMLVFSLALPVFAAQGNNDDTQGSITIQDAHNGFTYSIYQILVMESFNTDENSYVYTPSAKWNDWVADPDKGGKYFVIDPKYGTVTWKTGADETQCVKDAIAYAKDPATYIAPETSGKKIADQDLVFANLELGYYLVDSSAGALCSIDNVIPDVYIREKNTLPTLDKKVVDPTDNGLEESISARIGREVTFDSKITVYQGISNLVYHDKMQETLDFKSFVGVYNADGTPVASSNYKVYYTGDTEMDDETCTFEVHFTEGFLNSITGATVFHVRYNAALNKNAIIAGEGNENEAQLTFGDDGKTTWDNAIVYTYMFGIVKTNASNHILQGAEFDLYYEQVGGTPIPLVEERPTSIPATELTDVNFYRPATPDEYEKPGFVPAKIKAGKAAIWGARANITMYLEETLEPDGYNKLKSRVKIDALSGNNMPEYDTAGNYSHGGVEVENLAGTQLPQTGGIGTTLFYIFGGLMVAAAVVLLVTKKRMNAET